MRMTPSLRMSFLPLIDPAARAAGTVNGDSFRRQDFRDAATALIIVRCGVIDGTQDVKLQDAADDGSGSPDTFADVTGLAMTQIAATGDALVYVAEVDLLNSPDLREHIRPVLVDTGGSASIVSVDMVLLDAKESTVHSAPGAVQVTEAGTAPATIETLTAS